MWLDRHDIVIMQSLCELIQSMYRHYVRTITFYLWGYEIMNKVDPIKYPTQI
jgi:hypothetical protein